MAIGLLGLVGWVLTVPGVWAGIIGVPVDIRVNHRWFLFFGLAWSCLLLAILHGPSWLRALFGSAPMRLVGVVSFSAYLWHMPVLSGLYAVGAADWPLAPWLLLLVVLAVAMGSYVLFERPWREWRLPSARRRLGPAADVRISHRASRR